MDRKIVMGVAAVAGIGLLLYMRKSGDQATLAGTPISSGISGWASQPIVINATTKPLAVADTTAAAPAPVAKAPAPAPASVPWAMTPAAPDPIWNGSEWRQTNGQDAADGYALNHLTPEQRKGRTDAQIITSLII